MGSTKPMEASKARFAFSASALVAIFLAIITTTWKVAEISTELRWSLDQNTQAVVSLRNDFVRYNKLLKQLNPSLVLPEDVPSTGGK